MKAGKRGLRRGLARRAMTVANAPAQSGNRARTSAASASRSAKGSAWRTVSAQSRLASAGCSTSVAGASSCAFDEAVCELAPDLSCQTTSLSTA